MPQEGDTDVVVVRPINVDEDDDAWSTSLETWRQAVLRLSGNSVEVLEVGADEAGSKLGSRSPVWADVRRDGRIVHGLGIEELRGPG